MTNFSPAAAAPIPVPPDRVVVCESFDGLLQLSGGNGRVVTLTDVDTGERMARALVRRYTEVVKGGPQSGQEITATYPGPNRNLVECSALPGIFEYTLSLLP